MIYPIAPCPKPRMTRRDKWAKRPCVLRYRAFKDKCRLVYRVTLPEPCLMRFCMPMPKSWPLKKCAEMNGKPHRQKPDLDNLVKGLWDAVMARDEVLWRIKAEKVWANAAAIQILPLTEEQWQAWQKAA